MTIKQQSAGDFTGLADDYSAHRPDYSQSVLNGLLGLLDKHSSEIDVVDIGAGTGIWSRMVHATGVNSVTAIEPNLHMRTNGVKDSFDTSIKWLDGTSEASGLDDSVCDWLTMASAFHWADFDIAIKEFHRVLRPGGRFTALWNPRLIKINPLLIDIEAQLETLRPGIRRVSSGLSGITETLSERLWNTPEFKDVVYLEGRHTIVMSKDRYMGAWRSVNDLRVQLGNIKFQQFLDFVEYRLKNEVNVEATYLTRAWSAKSVG